MAATHPESANHRAPQPRWHHARSTVGRQKGHNADAHGEFSLGDGSLLLVVADGMGNHESARTASRLAIEVIGQVYQSSSSAEPRERLRAALLAANERILAEATRLGVQGMGSTVVVAHVREEEVFVAHLGDSRLYHLRDGRVIWHTVDHIRSSPERVKSRREAPRVPPEGRIVTRALGFSRLADGSPLEPEVAEEPRRLRPGDVLLLCSDGLFDAVDDEEIARTATARTVVEAAGALVAAANHRGGNDDITISLCRYGTDRGTDGLDELPRPWWRKGVAMFALAVGIGLITLGGLIVTRARPPAAIPSTVTAPAAPSGDGLVIPDLAPLDGGRP